VQRCTGQTAVKKRIAGNISREKIEKYTEVKSAFNLVGASGELEGSCVLQVSATLV
jgi:hypothetical protein